MSDTDTMYQVEKSGGGMAQRVGDDVAAFLLHWHSGLGPMLRGRRADAEGKMRSRASLVASYLAWAKIFGVENITLIMISTPSPRFCGR